MKWLFFIFVIGLISVIGVGGFGYFQMKAHDEPTLEDAPYVIQTFSQDGKMIPSRVYYAADVEIVDGKPVIKQYWTFDGGAYKKENKEKVLPENSRIVRRSK